MWRKFGHSWLGGTHSVQTVPHYQDFHSGTGSGSEQTLAGQSCWSGTQLHTYNKSVTETLEHELTGDECSLLRHYCDGCLLPNSTDPFLVIRLFPDFEDCCGSLVDCICPVGASLDEASGKTLYRLMVKTLNKKKLNGHSDTAWRTYLGFS